MSTDSISLSMKNAMIELVRNTVLCRASHFTAHWDQPLFCIMWPWRTGEDLILTSLSLSQQYCFWPWCSQEFTFKNIKIFILYDCMIHCMISKLVSSWRPKIDRTRSKFTGITILVGTFGPQDIPGAHTHTHTHTLSLSLSLSHTHTHTHTHTHSLSLTHTHTPHTLSLSLSLTHKHTHTHSLTHTQLWVVFVSTALIPALQEFHSYTYWDVSSESIIKTSQTAQSWIFILEGSLHEYLHLLSNSFAKAVFFAKSANKWIYLLICLQTFNSTFTGLVSYIHMRVTEKEDRHVILGFCLWRHMQHRHYCVTHTHTHTHTLTHTYGC